MSFRGKGRTDAYENRGQLLLEQYPLRKSNHVRISTSNTYVRSGICDITTGAKLPASASLV